MCQIIVVPAGKKVNMRKLDKAQKHNSDGYGVSWFENGQINTYKTMNYNTFKGVVSALRPYSKIVHLRYATVGDTNITNCHPFDVPTGVMFHNGTISGMIPPKRYINGKYQSAGSDSSELAELINKVDYESIMDISPLVEKLIGDKINRLVFMEDDGAITIVNEQLGIEEDGIWYSNDYHNKEEGWCRHGSCQPKKIKKIKKVEGKVLPIEKKAQVFVYGTLKKGHGNHSHFLSGATFLGNASTVDKWTMVGKHRAFPYVVEKNEVIGNNIKGEVYEVTQAQLNKLDVLEGVACNHYKKVSVPVSFSNDASTMQVIMYVACDKPSGYHLEEKITVWSNRLQHA